MNPDALLSFPHFIIPVDYGYPVENYIRDSRVNFTQPYINSEKFPVTRKTKKNLLVFLTSFDSKKYLDGIRGPMAIEEMRLVGLRPLDVFEHLALVKFLEPDREYDELTSKDSFISLGSTWIDPLKHLLAPYYYCAKNERRVSLDEYNGDWNNHWRFAGTPADKSLLSALLEQLHY